MASKKQVVEWRPPVRGVTQIVGFPDSGKTALALSVPGVDPGRYHFYDFDGKSAGVAQDFADDGTPLGVYENMLVKTAGMKPLEVFEAVDEMVQKNMEENPPLVTIFDNWAPPMEEALRAKFMTLVDKLTDISQNMAKSMSMLTWPASYKFYAQWLAKIAEVSPMVIIICHIKPSRIGMQKIPGVWEAKGQQPLNELPVFRVWLETSQAYNGAPVGIVMKRLHKKVVTTTGIRPVNVLPLRLAPCTWDKVIAYMQNPVGDRELLPEEIPSDFELTLIGGELTPDQKESLRAAQELSKRDNADAELEGVTVAMEPWAAEVKKLGEEGMSAPAIFRKLKDKYPDISVPKIIQLL